jgi:hypothetical protein
MRRTLRINAKCVDAFWGQLMEDGKPVGEYTGYVPAIFPGEHYGDYIELDIDLETGQILNWRKPTAKQITDFKKLLTK